jgi:hypothetical protein
MGDLLRWSGATDPCRRRPPADLHHRRPLVARLTGHPLDGSKVTKCFQAACRDAGVRPIRFHDLRHIFATQLAASGKVSLRTLQEFLGHADAKTRQIYAHLRTLRSRNRDGQRRFCCRARRGQAQRGPRLSAQGRSGRRGDGGALPLCPVEASVSCVRQRARSSSVATVSAETGDVLVWCESGSEPRLYGAALRNTEPARGTLDRNRC